MIEDIPFLLESLRNYYDRTLLMKVAYWPDLDSFRFLLSFDQDLNVANMDGWNIAHYIVFGSRDDNVVELLEMLKTKITKRMFKRLINNVNRYGRSSLHNAAKKNRHKTIIFLIENGANINIRDYHDLLPEEHKRCDEETKQIFRKYRKQW